MQVSIVRKSDGAMTTYTAAQVRAMARGACKGLGRLQLYWICVHEDTAAVQLVVQYERTDGWCSSVTVAL